VHPPERQGLSGTSCQHVLGTLSVALEWAVKRGDLACNVAKDVDRPKRDTAKFAVWSIDELGRFLDHVADDRLFPLWRLAAYTGARRSELLGLHWSDVDLDAGTIAIRRARVRIAYEMVDQDRTKAKQSERVVGLDPETVQVLRRWAKAQKAERLAPPWTDSGYVFTAEDGRLVYADHVANRYGRLVAGAGVPAIRFHDLRHTHATLALKGLYALMRGWRGRIDATGRCCHGVPQRRRSRSR
jgi:integrase